MAMSPLVLDDEEMAAADAAGRASDFRPEPVVPAMSPVQIAPNSNTGASLTAPVSQPVYASVVPDAREVGQGDTSADQQTRRDRTPQGQWGIQVGAHLTRDKAETQLRQVQQQSRDLVGKAKFAIVELNVRGEVFYRVRFGAFTPAKAESLCEQLQKRGTSCLVVTDGAWDASNARATLPIAVR
jgi:cell division protein FtsN